MCPLAPPAFSKKNRHRTGVAAPIAMCNIAGQIDATDFPHTPYRGIEDRLADAVDLLTDRGNTAGNTVAAHFVLVEMVAGETNDKLLHILAGFVLGGVANHFQEAKTP